MSNSRVALPGDREGGTDHSQFAKHLSAKRATRIRRISHHVLGVGRYSAVKKSAKKT